MRSADHARYLAPPIAEDLARKMVLVAGPRQVGKTTLARRMLGKRQDAYLNWDVAEHRGRILAGDLPSSPLWVFDEIHFGGFPEPFFSGSERSAKRWSREYRSRLVREDVTGLERVQDLGNMELLAMRVPAGHARQQEGEHDTGRHPVDARALVFADAGVRRLRPSLW